MTYDHLARGDLFAPNLVYALVGSGLAVAGAGGYLFGRYAQQKIGVLALFAGLTLAFTHFALMTGEGSDKIYGHRNDWGLALGSTAVFALIAGQATFFLIMGDWASRIEIGLSFFTGLGMLILSLAQYGSGRIVFMIGVTLLQLVTLYLGVSNMLRFDAQGWIYAIVLALGKAGLLFLFALGPNAFAAKGFSRGEFTWLYGGLLAAYAIGSSVYTWLLVELKTHYSQRTGVVFRPSAEGPEDGIPLYVVPGQATASA